VNEHQVTLAMLAEIAAVGSRVASITTRRLMSLTGINGHSTVRKKRGRARKKTEQLNDRRRLGKTAVTPVFGLFGFIRRNPGAAPRARFVCLPESVERTGHVVIGAAVRRVVMVTI